MLPFNCVKNPFLIQFAQKISKFFLLKEEMKD